MRTPGLFFYREGRMTESPDREKAREEIARRHGFASFAEMLDVSDPLPMLPSDKARTYMARKPKGQWFLWEDVPEGNGSREALPRSEVR